MDRKQIHKLGKAMNKPVKFVKKNAGFIISVAGYIAVSAILGSKDKN